jgi:Mg2+-importing ATPase
MLPVEKAGLPAPLIMWLSGAALIATIALPMIPVTAHYFEFVTPSAHHMSLILSLAVVYLVVTEIVKSPVVRFLKLT